MQGPTEEFRLNLKQTDAKINRRHQTRNSSCWGYLALRYVSPRWRGRGMNSSDNNTISAAGMWCTHNTAKRRFSGTSSIS